MSTSCALCITQRITIDSATKPAMVIGESPTPRRVIINNEGPGNVYLVPDENTPRSGGYILTPVDEPEVLEGWMGAVYALSENGVSQARLAVRSEVHS